MRMIYRRRTDQRHFEYIITIHIQTLYVQYHLMMNTMKRIKIL